MIDFKKFLEDEFKDTDGVIGLLVAARMDPPARDTVRKWFERGSMSASWLLLLFAAAEIVDGVPIRVSNYLPEGAAHEDKSQRT